MTFATGGLFKAGPVATLAAVGEFYHSSEESISKWVPKLRCCIAELLGLQGLE